MNWIKIGFYITWPLLGIVIMIFSAIYLHTHVIGQAKGWIGDESIKNHYLNALPGGWWHRIEAMGDWMWTAMSQSEHEKARRLLKIGYKRLDLSEDLMNSGKSVEASMAAERAVGYLQKAISACETDSQRWQKELASSIIFYDQVLGEMEEVSPEKIKPKFTELRYLSALKGSELGFISE